MLSNRRGKCQDSKGCIAEEKHLIFWDQSLCIVSTIQVMNNPAMKKADIRDGICDPAHLPFPPISECQKKLSVGPLTPSVDTITLYTLNVPSLRKKTCPERVNVIATLAFPATNS